MPRRSSRRQGAAFDGAGRLAAAIARPSARVRGLHHGDACGRCDRHQCPLHAEGAASGAYFCDSAVASARRRAAPRPQPVQAVPAADQASLQLIGNIQRELARKGFYDGPADGIWGAKTDTAVRDFVSADRLKDSILKPTMVCCVPSLRSLQSRRSSSAAEPTRRSDRKTYRTVQEGDGGAAGARRFRLRTDQADRGSRSGDASRGGKVRAGSSDARHRADFRPLRA